MPGRVVIISGPPGAGKSTVARALAEQSDLPRAVHLHTDDFYGYIRKGYRDPWLPEAQVQNVAVVNAAAAAAARYAEGGYEVLVDGVIGPWMLEPWLALRDHVSDIHYVVLRPDEDTAAKRLLTRKLSFALKDENVARFLWRQFANLGVYEPHALDTTGQEIAETVAKLKSLLTAERFRLKRRSA